ncbi:helix-turn-helix domain-containing protein [Oculatella sp. LEGE 06141]|uniref:helix-turn-helix domain-containing protein n=1 Tax=Oculatella sp. LEGE 06141 TaxID=1828648 RepID=UPI00187E989A|nr:helix-turn-helix domain-containing protein [Oculatella sp. LEGE 06141]MBE9177952.1 helix-turn-helix domain-containing protein [Oculatella sp. LEGE 06141]
MSQVSASNYTCLLRSLMQEAGVSSFKALSQVAGVSEWQVRQLRQGRAAQMRLQELHRISQALHLSVADLVETFSELALHGAPTGTAPSNVNVEAWQQDYQRLQAQLAAQREQLWQEFQLASLQTLESWMLQFPTAAYAAQQNPQIPAARLLPLMRPVEQLLTQWGIEAIAPVGTELPYDPHFHQLMDGTAAPGEPVRIRYTGYRQGDKLLHRAKVSPVVHDLP